MNVLLRVLILVIAFFASSEAFAQYRVIVGIGSNNSTSGQMQPGSRINDVAWTATSRVININNNVGATVTVYFADGRAARFAVSQTGTLIPLTDSKPAPNSTARGTAS